MIRVEIYNGREHPATRPHTTSRHRDEREARTAAAHGLGHGSLRGASTWGRYQGGSVYQFGPRNENNEHDFAVIVDEDEIAEDDVI